jgi:hypothetical protein
MACLLMLTTQVWASTSDISVDENPDIGALFPVLGQVITGEADGEQFISVANDIGESFKAGTNPTFTKVESSFVEWSYNRGVGTIPNACVDGYDASGLLCYEQCPAGYDDVAGVCWQQCPSGFSDGGALCTKWAWWPETIAKDSFMQDIQSMHCADGTVDEAGLCYTPCEDTFTGVGPLCFGTFGGLADQQRIREQAGEQQDAALAQLGAGGIVLGESQTPKLKTDLSFTPIVCGIANTEGAFGLPLPGADSIGGLIVDAAGDGIVGAISDSVAQDGTAWFVPSVSDTVLFDFSMDATCIDDGVKATAGLNFKPSITVKASTRMFDSALHNLAGVDLGIMSISVYELVPFRVYGTVGTTLGVDATISSTIDRSMEPLIIDGRQHAHTTALSIIPEQDLWLSAEAYLRITSIFSFIPDLLQLGAEFKLWILELSLPYSLEEGVRDNEGVAEVYKAESLKGTLSSGRGYIDTFLKILGIKTEVFGDEADIHWEGYNTDTVFFETNEAAPVAQ